MYMQSMRQVLQFMNFALAEGMFSTLHPGESTLSPMHASIDMRAHRAHLAMMSPGGGMDGALPISNLMQYTSAVGNLNSNIRFI